MDLIRPFDSKLNFEWGFAEKITCQSDLVDQKDFDQITRLCLVTIAISSTVAISTGIIIATGGVALPVILALAISSSVDFLSVVGVAISSCMHHHQVCNRAGMLDSCSAPHMNFWKTNKLGKTEMIPTKHCADTQEWRKKLIKAAEHNIVLSGNYCGGRAFDEILDLIKEQMDIKPNLHVVILSAPKFLKDEMISMEDLGGKKVTYQVRNITKLKELQLHYTNRFSLVKCPSVWMTNHGLKRATNHTKYFGIDFGKYYILGGSAIKDNFNQEGVDDPLLLLEHFDYSEFTNEMGELQHRAKLFYEQINDFVVETQTANPDMPIGSVISKLKQFMKPNVGLISKNAEFFDNSVESQLEHVTKILSRLESSMDLLSQAEDNDLTRINSTTRLNAIWKEISSYNTFLEAVKKKNMAELIELLDTCRNKYDSMHYLGAGEINSFDDSIIDFDQDSFFRSITNFVFGLSAKIGELQYAGSCGTFDNGLTGYFVPSNFRDMDFVFHNQKGERSPGRKLFLQMLTLAYRWERLNVGYDNNKENPIYFPTEIPRFPIFISERVVHSHQKLGMEKVEPIEIQEGDTPLVLLMKKPMVHWRKVKTEVIDFDKNASVAKKGKMKILYSGPEQPNQTSEFRREILTQIEAAQEEIVINHMYFHPTDDVFEALINAANRGVRITIITCGVSQKVSNGQRLFAPRNKFNYVELLHLIESNRRENVEIYEYTQSYKGLHKKVMIFDKRYVLAGSSNLGYKSLVTTSDHEVNFLSLSPKFAKNCIEICDIDKKLSQKVDNNTQLSISDYLVAGMHSIAAPLIG